MSGVMDSHFEQMLAPSIRSISSSVNKELFLPSLKFDGKRDGYYFSKGEKGLGYYFDTRYSFKKDDKEGSKKRSLENLTHEPSSFQPPGTQ